MYLIFILILFIPTFAEEEIPINQMKLPNVFITVHIEDNTVMKNVNRIQQKLIRADPNFNSTLKKLTSLHVTFDVFYIDRDELPKAKTALETAATMSAEHFGPLNIVFQGIEAFNNVILVSRTSKNSQIVLTQYQKKTNDIFKSFGFEPMSKFDIYKPHMTLSEIRDGHPDLMHEWDFLLNNKTKLGNFTPKKIQICAMKMAPEDLYYPVLAEAYFPKL